MARQPSGLATARGFTLVELLVALLVMAVLTLMAWRGVDGIVRARDISQAELDRSLRLNTAIAQWDRDLLALSDTTAVPPLSYDGATLRLVRRVDAGTIGPNSGPGVQLVAWSLRGAQWTRWAGPVVTRVADLQESWLRSQQATADAGAALVLLDGVSDLQIQFFRNNGWSNPQSSGDIGPGGGGAAGSGRGDGALQRESSLYGVRLVLGLGAQRLTRDLALALQQP